MILTLVTIEKRQAPKLQSAEPYFQDFHKMALSSHSPCCYDKCRVNVIQYCQTEYSYCKGDQFGEKTGKKLKPTPLIYWEMCQSTLVQND